MKVSLYDCFQAKVGKDKPFCAKGHPFPGGTSLRSLERGDPLRLAVCQNCPDFESMGDPYPDSLKGWH